MRAWVSTIVVLIGLVLGGNAKPGDEVGRVPLSGPGARVLCVGPAVTVYLYDGRRVAAMSDSLELLWEKELLTKIVSGSVGWDGVLFVATEREVMAFDGQRGDKLWMIERPMERERSGLMAVSPLGQVFVDRQVLDGMTGERLVGWKQAPKISDVGRPLIDYERLRVYRNWGFQPEARDLRDGRLLWRNEEEAGGCTPHALGHDGLLYFKNSRGVKYHIASETGNVVVEVPRNEELADLVVDQEGNRYGFEPQRREVIARAADGDERWRFRTEARLNGPLALAASGILYVLTEERLWALSLDDGAALWSVEGWFRDYSLALNGELFVIEGRDLVRREGDGPMMNALWPMMGGGPARRGARESFPNRLKLLSQSPAWTVYDPKADDVTLEVSVQASAPVTYTWKRQGQVIADQGTRRYTFPTADASPEDVYTVEVSSGGELVASEPMRVSEGVPLRVEVRGAGDVRVEPESPFYREGDEVRLSAIPREGRAFLGWQVGEGREEGVMLEMKVPPTGMVVSAVFEQEPGDLLWEYDLDHLITKGALDDAGILYGATGWGQVHAIDTRIREGCWTWQAPGQERMGGVSDPILGVGDEVFVITNGHLWALNRTDGVVKWSRELVYGLSEDYPPAIGADGTLYLVDKDTLTALHPDDGSVRWERKDLFPRFPNKPVITYAGDVYVSGFWIDAASGETLASIPDNVVHGPTVATPSVMADDTVIDHRQGRLLAVHKEHGLRWQLGVGDVRWTSLIGPDQSIYTFTLGSHLNVIDGMTGEPKDRFPLSGGSNRGPALAADGTVYQFDAASSAIIAVDGNTGKERWKKGVTSINGIAFSPLIGKDGTVYSGGFSHSLAAFAGEASLADSSWPSKRGGNARNGRPGAIKRELAWHYQTPDDKFVLAEGETVQLQATARGALPLEYQWFKDSAPLFAGNKSRHLALLGDGELRAQYHLVATNAEGTLTSKVFEVSRGYPINIGVSGAGQITVEPPLELIPAGMEVRVEAVPVDGRILKSWSLDGQAISGSSHSFVVNGPQTVEAAFSVEEGDVLWRGARTVSFFASVAIDEQGIHYRFGQNGDVEAYDPHFCRSLWRWKLPKRRAAPNSVRLYAKHRLVIASTRKRHYGLDQRTGQLLWSFKSGEGAEDALVGLGEVLYLGGQKDVLAQVDPRTGKRLKEFAVPGDIHYLAVGADGHLYAIALEYDGRRRIAVRPQGDRRLMKLRVAPEFEVVWSRKIPPGSVDEFALSDRLYLSDGTFGVMGIDLESGRTVWSSDVVSGGYVVVGPGEKVYVSGNDGIAGFMGENGDLVWMRKRTGMLARPVISDHGRLYVWEKGWAALDLETGDRRWHLERSGRAVGAPLLDPSGLLFLSDSEGCAVVWVSGGPGGPWPKEFGDLANEGHPVHNKVP